MLSKNTKRRFYRVSAAALAAAVLVVTASSALRYALQSAPNPQSAVRILSPADVEADLSLKAWLNHSYALAPWPEIIPPEKIAPAVVVKGDNVSLEDVFVAGGGDAILVESGHNNFNRVEAIGGHAGINLKGPGYNNFNDVRAMSGKVLITPAN